MKNLSKQMMTSLDRPIPNVYRIFFPIGLAFGILGVSAWVPNLWQSSSTYPVRFHSQTMIDGFLFFIVYGFLGTAIPRMTSSFPTKISEAILGIVSACFFGISLIIDSDCMAITAGLIGYSGILAIGIRRIRARSKNPPAPFIFIMTTLIIAILYKLVALLSFLGHPFSNAILPSMQNVYLRTTMTGFILGVGFFLVPVLLSIPGSQQREAEGEAAVVRLANQKLNAIVTICFGVYLVSILLELFHGPFAYGIRALSIAIIAFSRWNLHRWPKHSGVQGKGIFISCWMLLIGHVAVAFFPSRSTHLIHLIYVLSASLMILMVATRVILVHGGHQRQIENRSILMGLSILCLVVAAATRVFAPFVPTLYLSHLAYAAVFWILAVVLWALSIWRQVGYKLP